MPILFDLFRAAPHLADLLNAPLSPRQLHGARRLAAFFDDDPPPPAEGPAIYCRSYAAFVQQGKRSEDEKPPHAIEADQALRLEVRSQVPFSPVELRFRFSTDDAFSDPPLLAGLLVGRRSLLVNANPIPLMMLHKTGQALIRVPLHVEEVFLPDSLLCVELKNPSLGRIKVEAIAVLDTFEERPRTPDTSAESFDEAGIEVDLSLPFGALRSMANAAFSGLVAAQGAELARKVAAAHRKTKEAREAMEGAGASPEAPGASPEGTP